MEKNHIGSYFLLCWPNSRIQLFQGSQYSVASDIWSLGLSLLEISFGIYHRVHSEQKDGFLVQYE